MVIAVSGDIDPEKISGKVEALFKDVQRRDLMKPIKNLPGATSPGSQTIKMDKEEALLMMGFRTVSMNNPDRYPLNVLSGLMSGTSGRLFTALRERSALAYTMGSIQKLGTDTGFMLFFKSYCQEKPIL